MGRTEQDLESRSRSGLPGLHLLFPGDPASVRHALNAARAALGAMPVGETLIGVVEIVLAEVLNNIVEHAYGTQPCGTVEVEAALGPSGLMFRVRDEGRPMPDGAAPAGAPHDLDVAADDLPEGGFGWFLIRELTEDLRYRRSGPVNELSFRIPLDATPARR